MKDLFILEVNSKYPAGRLFFLLEKIISRTNFFKGIYFNWQVRYINNKCAYLNFSTNAAYNWTVTKLSSTVSFENIFQVLLSLSIKYIIWLLLMQNNAPSYHYPNPSKKYLNKKWKKIKFRKITWKKYEIEKSCMKSLFVFIYIHVSESI